MTVLVGRHYDIASGAAGLPLETVRKYRAIWEIQGFDLPPEPQTVTRTVKIKKQREKVGTALKQRIESLITIKTGKNCGCSNLATQMDAWGIAGCEMRRGEIIGHLVGNRAILVEALQSEKSQQGWLGSIAGAAIAMLPDVGLRTGAGWLLDQAIADARVQPVHVPRPRRSSQAIRTHRVMTLSTTQVKLRDAAQSAPPPLPDPFTDTPVIHFGAHLWPVKGYWGWHAERWREVSETINGRCIVGVVTDAETDTLEDVQHQLGDRFELFTAANTPQGENPTFRELQKRIPQGQNDILIYAHGKGVRSHTAASESVRIWTECMYETVVHNSERVIEQLAKGYKCFGAFRSFGDMPLSPANRWHYSGTFFAVRAKHIGQKTVKTGYGGVEAWCGDHTPASESWCEFTDAPGFKFGYDIAAIYPTIVDAQMQWEVDRIGGPRCEQHKRELEWFLALIDDTFGEHVYRYGKTFPVHVLVIGSRNGGLEYQLQQRGHTTVSIDIAPQPDNTVENMIIGSSADPDVQRRARAAGPFDVVFIDGDHSFEGVQKDYWFAQSLNPPVIAFHDIAVAIKHRNEGCDVDRLWKLIKESGRKTEEKIVGCGWGGIGVVWRDRNARSSV